MNDYKELIAKCDEWICKADNIGADNLANHISACADAIEQLVKERDAAVADLSMHGRYCVTCAHSTTDGPHVWPCNDKRLRCATDDNKNWEWRGLENNT